MAQGAKRIEIPGGWTHRHRLSPAAVGFASWLGLGLPCAVPLAAMVSFDARSFVLSLLPCAAAFAFIGLTIGVVRRLPVPVGALVGLVALSSAAFIAAPMNVFLPPWVIVFGITGFLFGIATGTLFFFIERRCRRDASETKLCRGIIDLGGTLVVVPAVFLGMWFLGDVAWSLWFHARVERELSAETDRVKETFGKLGPYGGSISSETGRGGGFVRLTLSFRGRGIGDSRLRELRNLQCPHTILKLDLSGNGITDRGLESISDLRGIEYLNLAGTDITDRGIEYLTGLDNLTTLDVGGTRVTQGCARSLERLPRLRTVYAPGTSLAHINGVRVLSVTGPDL